MLKKEFWEFISKLPFVKTVFIIQTIIYCLCIPVMTIYFLYPSVYQSEDIYKLLLLGVSTGAVVYTLLFCLYLFIIVIDYTSKNENISEKRLLELAGLQTNVAITIVSIIEFFNYNIFHSSIISGINAIVLLFVLGSGALIIQIIMAFFRGIKQRRHRLNSVKSTNPNNNHSPIPPSNHAGGGC